jgi:hypothetical protein
MADVVMTRINYEAGDDSVLSNLYPLVIIAIDDKVFTSCAANSIALSLDTNVNYFEAAICEKNIYKYTPGDTFGGSATSNANEMYSKFFDALTKA